MIKNGLCWPRKWRTWESQIFDVLPDDGGWISQQKVRGDLGMKSDRFNDARQGLIRRGCIELSQDGKQFRRATNAPAWNIRKIRKPIHQFGFSDTHRWTPPFPIGGCVPLRSGQNQKNVFGSFSEFSGQIPPPPSSKKFDYQNAVVMACEAKRTLFPHDSL